MSLRDTALLVLALTLGALLVARRLRTPAPVVLAVVGACAGALWRFVPGLPLVRMRPDAVLFAFLPPLLTTAAYAVPLRAFRRNLVPISLLAVGLVSVTMVSVAGITHLALGLPWAAAFVLGAVVAPPDPVAATAIAERTGLSHRLVVILEGEGLVNDAVAISLYGLAVEAAVRGSFSWSHAALVLLREAPTGVAIGLAVGWGVATVRRHVQDLWFEVGMSLLAPYATYHLAVRTGGSGVLACVSLGFLLRHYAAGLSTPAIQLAARTVWAAVRFVSSSVVFLLIGLLVGEVAAVDLNPRLLGVGALVATTVAVVRLAWMYTVPIAVRWVGYGVPVPSWSELTVLGWAGMRGVVSLALVLALPPQLDAVSGTRHVLVFLTFSVIVATLILQGMALLPLVEALHAGDPTREARDERRARSRARRRGLVALRRAVLEEGIDEARCRVLVDRIESGRVGIARAGTIGPWEGDEGPLLRAIAAQRREVERMRAAGQLGESLAERLVTELDVDAMSTRGDSARITGG